MLPDSPAFSWVIEVKGYKRWAFWLVVVGMNSIAAYLIAHLFEDFIAARSESTLAGAFQIFGTALQPLIQGIAVLLTYWLILFWDVPPETIPAHLIGASGGQSTRTRLRVLLQRFGVPLQRSAGDHGNIVRGNSSA